MRPGPASQTGRLLALLELGGWWTTRDLLSEVPSVVHSRISDLRAKGYTIEHKTTGEGAGGSLYRLVGFRGVAPSAGTVEPSPADGGASGLPLDVPFVPLQADEGGETAASPSQLSMLAPEEDRPHMYAREGRAA